MVYIKSDKTELRKKEKKKLILSTAARVFAERGYHQTTVKDVTDAAQISVGTFYLYFKSKEDLFEKLYDEMHMLLNNIKDYAFSKPAASPAECYANVIVASIWTYQRFRELSKILLIEAVGLNPAFEAKYSTIMVRACDSMNALLNNLKKMGIIEIPDTKVAALALEGSFNHAILYWLRTDDQTDIRLFAYPLTVFSLQAINMSFNPDAIKGCIHEMFQELDHNEADFTQFK
jgi:AcrR family transcriptional regulator